MNTIKVQEQIHKRILFVDWKNFYYDVYHQFKFVYLIKSFIFTQVSCCIWKKHVKTYIKQDEYGVPLNWLDNHFKNTPKDTLEIIGQKLKPWGWSALWLIIYTLLLLHHERYSGINKIIGG